MFERTFAARKAVWGPGCPPSLPLSVRTCWLVMPPPANIFSLSDRIVVVLDVLYLYYIV